MLLGCSYGTPSDPEISEMFGGSRLAAVDPASGTISCHQGTGTVQQCRGVWHCATVRR